MKITKNIEKFEVSFTKLVKYIFEFDIEEDIWDTAVVDIKGNRREKNEFFKYVHEFKKRYAKYGDLDMTYFIIAANVHDENMIIDNYVQKLGFELTVKIMAMFNKIAKYSEIIRLREDGTTYEVPGELKVVDINIEEDKIIFGGENCKDKFMAIILKIEKILSEGIESSKFYRSLDDFYEGLYFIESKTTGKALKDITKEDIIERHLYKLRTFRIIEETKRLCKIETNKEDFRQKEWDYRFELDDLEYLLDDILQDSKLGENIIREKKEGIRVK